MFWGVVQHFQQEDNLFFRGRQTFFNWDGQNQGDKIVPTVSQFV